MLDEIRDEIEGLCKSIDLSRQMDSFGQLRVAHEYTVLGQLLVITEFPSDEKSCMQALQVFLKEQWQLIQDTHLNYFDNTDSLMSQLLIKIAKMLASYDIAQCGESKIQQPLSAIEYLMPSISTESTDYPKYPHLYCIFDEDKKCWRDVDINSILRSHLLGKGGKHLIPVRLLCNQEEDDLISHLPNVYFDLFSEDGGSAEHIDADETNKLESHSDLTREVVDARAEYIAACDKNNSLYAQLMRLQESLHRYSKFGSGKEEKAAKAMDMAVQAFFDFYEKLRTQEKEKLPKLLRDELQTLYDYNYGNREPDINSCVSTRREAIINAMHGHDALLLKITLSGDAADSLLKESLNRYRRLKSQLAEKIAAGRYRGTQKSTLSLALFKHYKVDLRVYDSDTLMDVLACLSAADVEEYLRSIKETPLIKVMLMDQGAIFTLFQSLSTDKLAVLLHVFDDKWHEVYDKNAMYFAGLLDTLDEDKIQCLLRHMGQSEEQQSMESIVRCEKIVNLMQLSLAVGYKTSVKTLEKLGTPYYLRKSQLSSAFACAAIGGFDAIALALLEEIESEEEKKSALNDTLVQAAQLGKSKAVHWLVGKGADALHKDKYGNSMLALACRSGNLALMQYLIDLGNDINALNSNSCPMLMHAAASNNPDAVIFVAGRLDNFDINRQDNDGDTALHDAAKLGAMQSAEKLINLEADLRIKNRLQENPLLVAFKHKQFKTVSYLLTAAFENSQLDLNAATINGDTLLMLAVAANEFELCCKILKYGSNSCKTLEDCRNYIKMLEHTNTHGQTARNTCNDSDIARQLADYRRNILQKKDRLYAAERLSQGRTGFFSRQRRRASQGNTQHLRRNCALM